MGISRIMAGPCHQAGAEFVAISFHPAELYMFSAEQAAFHGRLPRKFAHARLDRAGSCAFEGMNDELPGNL